jgi:site-specific recombinase XerD
MSYNKIKKEMEKYEMLDGMAETIDISKITLSERRSLVEEKIEDYCEYLRRSRRPDNTIKGFRTLFNIIKSFHDNGGPRTYIINREWFEDLAEYMMNNNKSNSSICVTMERLKTVLKHYNVAFKYEMNAFFRDKQAKHLIQDEILTEEEIEKVWKIEPKSWSAKAMRDKFLISLYAGCRLSEINSVSLSKDETGRKIIIFYGQKDHECRSMPLHPRLEPIIRAERYKTTTTTPMHFYTFRKGLAIEGKATETKRVGGKIIRQLVDREKAITFHSARKTFAVRLLESDMDIYMVAKNLGHSSIQMTMKYYTFVRSKALADKTFEAFRKLN